MKRIIVSLAAVLSLAACGGADIDDDAFLAAVRSDVSAFDRYSDDELTEMAEVACRELASIPAVAAIDWAEGISESDREHLVYLALTKGCPQASHSG